MIPLTSLKHTKRKGAADTNINLGYRLVREKEFSWQ